MGVGDVSGADGEVAEGDCGEPPSPRPASELSAAVPATAPLPVKRLGMIWIYRIASCCGWGQPRSERSGENEHQTRILFRSIPLRTNRLGKGRHGDAGWIGELADGTKIYGRASTVAEVLNGDRVVIAKGKGCGQLTNWNGRQCDLSVWNRQGTPLLESKLAT